jgi:predicted lipoprotein with Yx(FWY)xxD motif
MKTRKTLLTLALAAAASTLSVALSAEVLAPANASPAAPTVAPAKKILVIDHKTNTVRYVYAPVQSEFVGTSAKAAPATPGPSRSATGHP